MYRKVAPEYLRFLATVHGTCYEIALSRYLAVRDLYHRHRMVKFAVDVRGYVAASIVVAVFSMLVLAAAARAFDLG